MAEEKSLISKWLIPIVIIGECLLIVLFGYLGWIYTTWASAQIYITIIQCIAIAKVLLVLVLIIGFGTKRAGYTQEELDRWGDEALSGKPPL